MLALVVLLECRWSLRSVHGAKFGHTVDDWRKRILEFHGMPLLHEANLRCIAALYDNDDRPGGLHLHGDV